MLLAAKHIFGWARVERLKFILEPEDYYEGLNIRVIFMLETSLIQPHTFISFPPRVLASLAAQNRNTPAQASLGVKLTSCHD